MAARVRLPEASTVYSVTGEWDIIAVLEVREVDDVARIVTDQIGAIDAEHGEVPTGVAGHDRCRLRGAVGKGDDRAVTLGDHVIVGDDVAIG